MSSQGDDSVVRTSATEASFNDQCFLLNFIMTTYLGPDVFSDFPRCSASHRLSKGLPPYSAKNLGSSFLSFSQLESLFYYILRNAHPSLLLKPNMVHKYVKGNLNLPSSGMPETSMQFTNYFPPNLHEQKKYFEGHEVVKGIVVIDDPVVSYIKEENLARFKRLSGVEELRIDRIKSLGYQHEHKNGEENAGQSSMAKCETVAEDMMNEKVNLSAPKEQCNKKRQYDPRLLHALPEIIPMSNQHNEEAAGQRNSESETPVMMPLLTAPKMEHFVPDASITLTGTAAKGVVGPPLGVLDIGVGKSAYFFQVALPGVRRDYSEFSCEIESDGKVHIRGYTTGGKIIKKRSRVFHMKYQRQLCSPGQFTLSFSLPGPVDPRLFSPNFRTDGVLEGVVIRN